MLLGDDGGRHGSRSHGHVDLNGRCGNVNFRRGGFYLERVLTAFGCHDTGRDGCGCHRRFHFHRRRNHLDLRRGDICLDRLLVPCGGDTGHRGRCDHGRGDFSRRCLGSRCDNLRRRDLGDGFGRFGCHNAGRNGYRRADNRGFAAATAIRCWASARLASIFARK